MGVWERSPAGIAIANQNKSLLDDFQRALPDFRPEDNVGSPYCVRRYVVDGHLGGPEGLAIARQELSKRGMNLSSGLRAQPCGSGSSVGRRTSRVLHSQVMLRMRRMSPLPTWSRVGPFYACGRDPYFPAWPDVLQLNAFEPGLRRAVIETISSIAQQCDGIRCDMAMLVLNAIFERTWGGRAGPRPTTEYWVDVISAIKSRLSRISLYRRGLLGPGMGTPAAGLRFLLRQEALRSAGTQQCTRTSAFICVPILPTRKTTTVHREPRRASGGGNIFARKTTSRCPDDSYSAGNKTIS